MIACVDIICGILLAFVRTREVGVSSRKVVSRTFPHFSQSMLTPMLFMFTFNHPCLISVNKMHTYWARVPSLQCDTVVTDTVSVTTHNLAYRVGSPLLYRQLIFTCD